MGGVANFFIFFFWGGGGGEMLKGPPGNPARGLYTGVIAM